MREGVLSEQVYRSGRRPGVAEGLRARARGRRERKRGEERLSFLSGSLPCASRSRSRLHNPSPGRPRARGEGSVRSRPPACRGLRRHRAVAGCAGGGREKGRRGVQKAGALSDSLLSARPQFLLGRANAGRARATTYLWFASLCSVKDKRRRGRGAVLFCVVFSREGGRREGREEAGRRRGSAEVARPAARGEQEKRPKITIKNA